MVYLFLWLFFFWLVLCLYAFMCAVRMWLIQVLLLLSAFFCSCCRHKHQTFSASKPATKVSSVSVLSCLVYVRCVQSLSRSHCYFCTRKRVLNGYKRRTLFLFLGLLLLSDFQSTKTFWFHKRSPYFAHRLVTILSAIAPCRILKWSPN